MTNSAMPFFKLSTTPSKLLVVVVLILSFIGFLDASYLTFKHYSGTPINCAIFNGCEEVTNSKYATIGPVPVALLGAIYYALIFLLVIAYLDSKNPKFFNLAALMTPLGLIASLGLVYLQLFIIKAICLYCMVSAADSTLLFVAGALYFYKSIPNKTFTAPPTK